MPTIVVQRRSRDYMAYLQGHKEIWECGQTPESAIGSLVIRRATLLSVNVELDQDSIEAWKHVPTDRSPR